MSHIDNAAKLPSHRPAYPVCVQMVAAPPPRASSRSSSAGAAARGRARAARLARRTRPEWPAPPIPTREAMASGRARPVCMGLCRVVSPLTASWTGEELRNARCDLT